MRPRERAVILGLAMLTAACAGAAEVGISTPADNPTDDSSGVSLHVGDPDPWRFDEIELIEVDVLRVDDGDSMRVTIGGDEERVRLLGINAPERDECLGDESRSSLDGMVGDVAILGLEADGRDQFGRLLAHVFAGDVYVNRAQVSAGLAIVFSDRNVFQAHLVEAESNAEQTRVGLWSAEVCGGGPLPEGLEIARIEANPPGPDDEVLDEEVVAITNSTAFDMDLEGFVLRDESTANRFVFGAGTSIGAGETLQIVSGCDAPPGALAWCASGPVWNNGGDSALLLDPKGRIVDHLRY